MRLNKRRYCQMCEAPLPDDAAPQRKFCDECAAIRQRAAKQAFQQKHLDYYAAYMRRRRIRLKSLGICVECGKRKAETGKTRCTSCAVRAVTKMNTWKKKNGR